MSISVRQLLDDKGRGVYSVSPVATVYEAIEMMAEYEVGALPVMEDNRLIGIISERDYTRKVILEDRLSKSTSVQDIMTNEVVCVSPDNNIDECMALMNKNHIRHTPVLEESKVIGVITIMDGIKSILSEQDFKIEKMEHYIEGSS